jgi:uncharacterized RDD family membrane protein YckC
MHSAAPLSRRFLSLFYEALALAALVWAAASLYFGAEQVLRVPHVRVLYQAYLVVVMGIYFVWQWTRGGQTLAMKAWRLKVQRSDGSAATLPQCIARYALALVGTTALGITYLWAVLDSERAFLHDRLAGTRIVRL